MLHVADHLSRGLGCKQQTLQVPLLPGRKLDRKQRIRQTIENTSLNGGAMALSKPMAGEALQDLRICPQCGTKSYIRKKICINMFCKSYFMRQGQRPDQCSLEPQALGLAELEKGWVC